jgi:transcriptional regulator with XRE-family HTH domain
MKTIEQSLKYFRKIKNLTQREVATELGISQVHYCNIENGKSQPSMDLLDKFAEVYGIDLMVFAWCMFGQKDKLPPRVHKAVEKLTEVWKDEINRTLANGARNVAN